MRFLPSWDDAPEWANWLAQDKDGRWFWYESCPGAINDMWATNGGLRYETAWVLGWNKNRISRGQHEVVQKAGSKVAFLSKYVNVLEEVVNAAWKLCEGLYGTEHKQPFPVELLPEDRQEAAQELLDRLVRLAWVHSDLKREMKRSSDCADVYNTRGA